MSFFPPSKNLFQGAYFLKDGRQKSRGLMDNFFPHMRFSRPRSKQCLPHFFSPRFLKNCKFKSYLSSKNRNLFDSSSIKAAQLKTCKIIELTSKEFFIFAKILRPLPCSKILISFTRFRFLRWADRNFPLRFWYTVLLPAWTRNLS